jgi:hypothetical protein
MFPWTESTAWTVETDLKVGVVEGAAPYRFGRIVDVEVGTEGRIFVLDQQAAEVRVFDQGGSHLFSFGRAGEGPGELSDANPLGALAVLRISNGQLLVPDRRNVRVNRFTADGVFVRSFPLSLEAGEPVKSAVLPDGSYAVHLVNLPARWNGVVAFDTAGRVTDTIAEFELQPTPWGLAVPDEQGRTEVVQHSAIWSTMSDGALIFGNSTEPVFQVRNPDGSLRMTVNMPYADLTLSRRDQEAFLDRLLLGIWGDMLRAEGEPEDVVQAELRRGRDVYITPTQRPAFTGFAEGPHGTIWVRGAAAVDSISAHIIRLRPPLREFWGPRWYVFSPEGLFLGPVDIPSCITVFRISDHYIYGMETDPGLGTERVVRLRIK